MQNIGDLIAHWNVEHTKTDRAAHFEAAKNFVADNGLSSVLEVRDVSFPDWDRKPGCLGYPKTRIDFVLKAPYAGRVYRHAKTRDRLRGLSVIHLAFSRNAGVYDIKRHVGEVRGMTSGFRYSEKDAARISEWKGWDGFCCDCELSTNGKTCRYAHRTWTNFAGDVGDSFVYWSEWQPVHRRIFAGVRRMIENFGIGA